MEYDNEPTITRADFHEPADRGSEPISRIDYPIAITTTGKEQMMEQQKKQVLLVEDMPDIQELLRTVLENADYAVIAVEDGQAALEVLKTTACDVLVSDYNLPGIRGMALIKQVSTELPGIATILMSADPGVQLLADNCGAHAWFRKGDAMDGFLIAVAAAIDAVR